MPHIFNEEYFEKYYEGWNNTSFLQRYLFGLVEFRKPLYKYIKKEKAGGKLVDLGCGVGAFLSLAQNDFNTYGADISEYAISEAQKNSPKSKLKQFDGNKKLPFEDDFFDVTTSFDVVEHLDEPSGFIKEAARILKKDGLLVFTTPNPHSLGKRLKKDDWHGYRDESHYSIKKSKEWKDMVLAEGFDIVKLRYDFLWDPPYIKNVPGIFRRVVEGLFLVGPTLPLYLLNINRIKYLGENTLIIARKK
ncbi:MAG: class I SAM-dependent methyltransferase [Candidatus Spechtbacterales bacterium]|nr:class I SAM-dependent methyltransferase [Candidatus Spechtbacterales bacterium]